MEQHLYTYLNQKYGLKSLIVEHASAVIRASNKYEAVDNDVAVFVKMLRYVTLKAVDGVGVGVGGVCTPTVRPCCPSRSGRCDACW